MNLLLLLLKEGDLSLWKSMGLDVVTYNKVRQRDGKRDLVEGMVRGKEGGRAV